MTRPDDQQAALLPPMKWNAWGDPAEAKPLSESIRSLLKQALGIDDVGRCRPRARAGPAAAVGAVAAPIARGWRTIVGDRVLRHRRPSPAAARGRQVHAGPVAPQGHRRTGCARRGAAARRRRPDAPRFSGICAEHSIAVVPFGGGTSVVGGLDPIRGDFKAVISLDLRRLNQLHALDEVSGEAELGAGLTGPDAERLLGERGFSLGHFPQSFQFATIGGFAATRSSGQDSAGYGRFNDMVRGLRTVTPAGVLDLGRAPESAAGPDLRQLMIGSEGVFGIITRVRVRVHPVPEATRYEAWSFPDFATGADALRAVVQTGTGPTVIRLSDEAETGVNLATTESIGEDSITGGCLAITVFEGTDGARREPARRNPRAAGGAAAARRWARRPPAHGSTAGSARRICATRCCRRARCARRSRPRPTGPTLPALKAAVTEALTTSLAESGTPALVLCHISHVYPTGASLYFTVVAGQRGNPIEQWRKAKAAASDAMMRTGGTITHHHAVGADHRPWMRDEVGDLGVAVLRAVKATLDPAGILNPGKLIP